MIDITKRLARKKPYNQGKEEDRLDLVIVSDQLLTGFDSKFINMIYMDKMLKEGMLIQAMSRTNRTLNRDSKPHGKVRFYRQGDAMKEYVEMHCVSIHEAETIHYKKRKKKLEIKNLKI